MNPESGPTYKKVKDRAKTRNSIIVGVVAGLLAMLVTVNALSTGAEKEDVEQQKQDVEQQRDEAVAQKLTLAEQIQNECDAARLNGPICVNAAEAKAAPTPAASPPVTAEAITAAVRDYFTTNPVPAGREPTTAEVAAAVATYLDTNPPQPGRPPTTGEIEAAVALYYAANPPPAGQNGRDGDNGRPPTTEEIAAAVAAYLQANPPPAGRVGDPGVGVRTISDPARVDGVCQIRFELTDDTVRPIAVPDEFCGPPAPPAPDDEGQVG